MTARTLRRLCVVAGLLATQVPYASRPMTAQGSVTETDLDRASGTWSVNVGNAATGRVTSVPLETYVARVIAGEAEPNAPEAAQQAIAIAIRTYAIVNLRRHAREGFDLCDSTHCQVPRASTAVTRQAALATAGRILSYNGAPAPVFYSANCGGRSEVASEVWPGTNYPYLQSIADDVHADDMPWTLELTLAQIREALVPAGFTGRQLRGLEIDARNSSGRVSRLRVSGLQPDTVAGDAFRMAVGARALRSTAFSIEARADMVRFTGRGYGHGVGMCVVGAARRARRGETADAILGVYYPGVRVVTLDGVTSVARGRVDVPTVPIAPPAPAVASATPAAAVAPARTPDAVEVSRLVTARVDQGSLLVRQTDLEQRATKAMEAMARALGVKPSPIVVEWHESIEAFRTATNRPWWVSAAIDRNTIALSPVLMTSGADALDAALHAGVAEALMWAALDGRPAWVRVGGARFLSRSSPVMDLSGRARPCPSDRELQLAGSEREQHDAEARAEECFARAYARTGDWRTVR